ncbi:unnamed protein product [Tuber melanosporum]|uniref:(Perigord truffle) hypothetical protein n=1 Tax=Tuber melanosporum (strain Mel28) TaxID=656061 RepID=D5G9U8_TUBMM|nr:uncharacterized protein GSTUM_00005080001 [Tuber melanosporum]CAZ81291.1 unnamed protein product [Tuber melanosporum]
MPTVPVPTNSTATSPLPYNVQSQTPPRKTSGAFTPLGGSFGPGGGGGSGVEVVEGIGGGYVDTLPADRQLFVLCDPVAFRYLEEETCTTVVHRHRTLPGHEVYFVEQWACSRIHPTFVISTYTGDPNHVITIGVLNIPRDEAQWSPRLRVYFRAVTKFHARPKETPYGKLMVTNLSTFPSALTVIPVPDGDARLHREDFIVNEDLKRMGCSGRSALSLSMPADASQTKFHQLYRTSDKIPLYTSVMELVRLCQIALTLFEKLKPEYADGLLCDITERGIYDWWTEFGTEFYNIEPSDGTLGPTTVAALLGMVLGARNRLSSFGAPVPKDAFDLPQLKKAIYHFQRQQRIPRTRRLDRETMDKLQKAAMKNGSGASSGDIFAVPRAIKSTVVDLGGRAVGSSSAKVEGTSVETVDIEKFASHLSGERCKYLWRGKPRKSQSATGGGVGGSAGTQTPPAAVSMSRRNSVGGGSISENEGMIRHSGEFTATGYHVVSNPTNSSLGSSGGGSVTSPGLKEKESEGRDVSDLRKTVFKGMSGRMKGMKDVASAGADYVRGRGHHGRSYAKDFGVYEDSTEHTGTTTPLSGLKESERNEREHKGPSEHPVTSFLKLPFHTDSPAGSTGNINFLSVVSGDGGVATGNHSAAASVYREVMDAEGDDDGEEFVDANLPGRQWIDYDEGRILECGRKRNKSFSEYLKKCHEVRHEEYWPRRLSFSVAEEAVLDIGLLPSLDDDVQDESDLTLDTLSRHALNLQTLLADDRISEWTDRRLTTLENIFAYLDSGAGRLEGDLRRGSEVVNSMGEATRDMIDRQTMDLKAAVREVEALGARLQYELGSVRGQMADVEDAVDGFGRNVEEVEERALGLGEAIERGWGEWLLAVVFGIRRR